MKENSSIWPAAIAEAKGAKVTVSLFLFLACLGGGMFWAWNAGQSVSKAELRTLKSELAAQNSEVLTLVRNLDTTVKMQGATTSAMDTRIHVLAGETQVIKSKVDDCKR